MRKFYFSRLHFNGLFGQEIDEKKVFDDLRELQRVKSFIRSNNFGWIFKGINMESFEGKHLITGKLNKIELKKVETVISENTKEENQEIIENVKMKESLFVIDFSRNLISFETYRSLTKKQFIQAFIDGYRQIGVPYEPEFDLIYDENKLQEELKKMHSVSFAKFTLKTTNPDSREEFEKIDDLFQATDSATNYLYLSPKKGEFLNIKNPDSLVRQGLFMSAAGYGGGEVVGKDVNNNDFVIKTGDNNLETLEIHESKTEEEIKKTMVFRFRDFNKNNEGEN